MKPLWTALILMASSLPVLADVSKEEVRRLLDAHVSDQTIISYVQKNGPMQPLSIEDLSQLKNAGASDELLRALLDASRPSDAVTPSAGTTEPYASGSTTTVIYDTPRTYYYPTPYYVPYSYPSYYYYSYPYYSHYRPYRYSYSPHYGRSYPYSNYYYGYGRTVPHTTTVPRTVQPYRPAQPPRTTTPSTPSRPMPPPQQGRGHVPYR
jgi:hypothetical protein